MGTADGIRAAIGEARGTASLYRMCGEWSAYRYWRVKCPVCGEVIGTYRGKINRHWLMLPGEERTPQGRCTIRCKGSLKGIQ